jgi:hypothetical protein
MITGLNNVVSMDLGLEKKMFIILDVCLNEFLIAEFRCIFKSIF